MCLRSVSKLACQRVTKRLRLRSARVSGRLAPSPIPVAAGETCLERPEPQPGQTMATFRSARAVNSRVQSTQRKRAEAGREVQQRRAEAGGQAEQVGQQMGAEAREEAEAEHQRALAEIDLATAAALKELAERSADLAVQLAGKIVGAQLDKAAHARLIEEAVSGFAQTKASRN